MIPEMLQHEAIANRLKSLTADEKIVNHDITFDNWDIEYVYKEMVWIKRLDEPDATFVQKGLILLPVTQTKAPFAICEVLMVGPDVKKTKVGDFVFIPIANCSTYAQKTVGGYKTYFVREDGILAGVKYVGPKNVQEDIQENILLNS